MTKYSRLVVYNISVIKISEDKMGQTVYVDLFFMINFSMDFLCFFLTSQLLGDKLPLFRTLLASAVGGIYANVALFLSTGGIFSVALDVLVCVLMCLIAFGGQKGLLARTCVYVAVSMALGGFMTAIFALLNRAEPSLDGIEGDGISAWLLALLAVVSALLTLVGGRFFRRKSAKKYTYVCVRMNGKEKNIRALCDSGNLLREPLSGKACVIADVGAVSELISAELTAAVKSKSAEGIDRLKTDTARRIKLIPTKTAVSDGLLIALRTDGLLVGELGSMREVDAYLAMCELGSAEDNVQALVPTELLI